MGHDIALALVALGTAVTIAACLGAIAMRTVFDRLHFLTPVTALGCPLVAAGLSVQSGWGLTAASLILIAGLLFFAGPVLEAATGRRAGQFEGKVPGSSSPE